MPVGTRHQRGTDGVCGSSTSSPPDRTGAARPTWPRNRLPDSRIPHVNLDRGTSQARLDHRVRSPLALEAAPSPTSTLALATPDAGVAWGDVATWVTGLATFGLFIAAIFTAIYAYRSWRATAVSGLQPQASLVAAWSERSPNGTIGSRLSNRSALPIYKVRLVAHGKGDYVEIEVPGLVDGERTVVPPRFDAYVASISASEAKWTRGPFVEFGAIDVRLALAEDFTVEVFFRDAAGRAWQRDEGGVLAADAQDGMRAGLPRSNRA